MSIRNLSYEDWNLAVEAQIGRLTAPFSDDEPLSDKVSAEVITLREALNEEWEDRVGAEREAADARREPDYHGEEEDVANWIGPKGTWT